MEELQESEESQRLRKEQERERRRLRDRQRRQSMSLQERERHLARRRRNYQLRRQRAENTQLDSQIPVVARDAEIPPNQDLDVICASDPCVYSSGYARFASDLGQEALNKGHTKPESLQVPAGKLANLAGKLRLVRLKRLARTLNNPLSTCCHETAEGLKAKRTGSSNCMMTRSHSVGVLSNGLRLNRVKQLARSLNSSVGDNGCQGLVQSKTEGGERSLLSFSCPSEDATKTVC